jgi:hypothetical protein
MPVAEQIGMQKTWTDYESIPALSNSGMRDLAVSALRYWWLHVRPDREPRKETAEMRFGTALHRAVLEPGCFDQRYCRELQAEEIEGCLRTCDDIRAFIKGNGCQPKGTRKDDLIAQATTIDPHVPILDVLVARDEAANAGKVRLSADEWERVKGCADVLRAEPALQVILGDPDGRSEVCLTATDANYGVPLKGRLDWVTPSLTLDLKTFSQQRGKSIDRCVHDAIYHEKYNWQAFTYTTLRTLNGDRKPRYLIAFVESQKPHEVRLKELRPTIGNVCMYWERARIEVGGLMRLYADCRNRFGDKPWRIEQSVELLSDEDIPQLAWS